ncbi:unnamed protein product, partial [Staurois parvus]
MRTGHPAEMPSADTTEAGKTARGWIEEQVRSKNNSAQVPAPPPPQRSAVISCAVRSLWSSLCCPQSLVISCTVRS